MALVENDPGYVEPLSLEQRRANVAQSMSVDPGSLTYDPEADMFYGGRVSSGPLSGVKNALKHVPLLGGGIRSTEQAYEDYLGGDSGARWDVLRHALGTGAEIGTIPATIGSGVGLARAAARGPALIRQNLASAVGRVGPNAALKTGAKAAGSKGSRLWPAVRDIGASGGGRRALAETLTGQGPKLTGKAAREAARATKAAKTAASAGTKTSARVGQAAGTATKAGAGALDDALQLQKAVGAGRVVDTGTKAYKAGQAAGKAGGKLGKLAPKGSLRRAAAGGAIGAAGFSFVQGRGEDGELTPEAAEHIANQYGLAGEQVLQLEAVADNFVATGRAPDKMTALAMVYQPYEEERQRARQMEEDRAAMAMMLSAANPQLQAMRERAAANAAILQDLAGDLPPNLAPVANAYAQYQQNATEQGAYEDTLASLGEIWNARRNAALQAQEAAATQGGFEEFLAEMQQG